MNGELLSAQGYAYLSVPIWFFSAVFVPWAAGRPGNETGLSLPPRRAGESGRGTRIEGLQGVGWGLFGGGLETV